MFRENKIINIPNILSFLRIILSLNLFIIWDKPYILLSIILVIGFTDILDGYIARKFNQKTIVGAWLDSIADFVFYISLIICIIIYDINKILELKYFFIIILILKILSIIMCFIKYKKIGFLHTLGNKITGIIFIGICIFILFKDNIGIRIGLYFSILSSLEELIINIIGKKYKENIKRIYEIIIKLCTVLLHITNSMRYRRCSRPRGSKNRSRLRLCAVFSHPHSSPLKTFGFSYKVVWNVAYLERYAHVF